MCVRVCVGVCVLLPNHLIGAGGEGDDGPGLAACLSAYRSSQLMGKFKN